LLKFREGASALKEEKRPQGKKMIIGLKRIGELHRAENRCEGAGGRGAPDREERVEAQ